MGVSLAKPRWQVSIVFVEWRCIRIPSWLFHVIFGFLVCTSAVGFLIVSQALRRGWGELSEPGYWVGKAIVFAVAAVIYGVTAAIRGWGRGTKPKAFPPGGALGLRTLVSKGIVAWWMISAKKRGSKPATFRVPLI